MKRFPWAAILSVLLAMGITNCDFRSDDEVFSSVFGFKRPANWTLKSRARGLDRSPQEIHFLFDVAKAVDDPWRPEDHGFSAWQPMTREQRFVSGSFVLDNSGLSSSAVFSIMRRTSQKLIVYDPADGRLIALKANNAMGVRYPDEGESK